jgi:hypothetical protein
MRSILLACCLLALGTATAAQEAGSVPAPRPPAAPQAADAPKPPVPQVNADQLGVSVDRIHLRFLRTPTFGQTFDPERLRLSSYVDVVAVAPMLELFGPNAKKELTSRAVPWGSPTHQEMYEIMTPRQFRTPAFDLTKLSDWLAQGLSKIRSKSEDEE